MDMRKIKKLIELLQQTGVAEIEIREGEESVRITREIQKPASMVIAAPAAPHSAAPAESSPLPIAETTPTASPPPEVEKHMVKAPMVGTVYLSANPDSKPFVEIGDKVSKGQTLCLIEAMKMFNPIESDKTGVVTARFVDNGTPVEFHQPLFVIE